MPPGSQSDPGGSEPGASAPGTQTQAWGTAPSAWRPSTALQWASHVGRARRRPWIAFYHSHSNWSSRKFCRRAGSQMFLLSYSSQSCDFLTQGDVKCQLPPPRWALWLGLCVPLDGGLLWDTQQTQCLLMWLDIKKKRNSVYSQLVTSLNCNAAPRLLKTYLHPSLQEAAVRVKINILTCDL